MTIYKYPIKIVDEQEIEVGSDSVVLHAGLDPKGTPCLWALVNPENPAKRLKVFVVGTGNPIPMSPCRYVGSFAHGPFMWHVFIDVPVGNRGTTIAEVLQ